MLISRDIAYFNRGSQRFYLPPSRIRDSRIALSAGKDGGVRVTALDTIPPVKNLVKIFDPCTCTRTKLVSFSGNVAFRYYSLFIVNFIYSFFQT